MSMPVQQVLNQLQAARGAAKPLIAIPFTYLMLFASVASVATATAQMQIQADSDFLVAETSVSVVDQTTKLPLASPNNDGLIQLTDQGSGMTLFSSSIPLSSWFGTAQLPFVLPLPKVFSANSTITGALTTNTLVNASSFFLTFHGIKLYKPSKPS